MGRESWRKQSRDGRRAQGAGQGSERAGKAPGMLGVRAGAWDRTKKRPRPGQREEVGGQQMGEEEGGAPSGRIRWRMMLGQKVAFEMWKC